MSVQSELTRITNDRNTIRTKLVALGLATSTASLDDCADAVNGMVNQGAVSATVKEGESYTIPAGYHNGSGVVKGTAGGGNYTLQARTVTPTKGQQSITPEQGYYGLSSVTVEAIPENYQDVSSVTATAADVLTTKVFVAADGTATAGTMPNNGTITTQTLSASKTSYTIPRGYHSGSGKVQIVGESVTATPGYTSGGSDTTITPTTGKVITEVTLKGDAYLDNPYIRSGYSIYGVGGTFSSSMTVSSGQTAVTKNTSGVSAQILSGYSAFIDGEEVKGSIAIKSGTDLSASGATVTVPAGYYAEQATKSVASGTAGTPSATKTISGTTATVTPKVTNTAGYISGGTKTGTGVTVTINDLTTTRTSTDLTLTGLGSVAGDTSTTILAGYYPSDFTVSITNDIETALAAI